MPPRQSRIAIEPMKEMAEGKHIDDDWSGLASSAERRKRQNRLNQRAYRHRKALEIQNEPSNGLRIVESKWQPQPLVLYEPKQQAQVIQSKPKSPTSSTSSITGRNTTHVSPHHVLNPRITPPITDFRLSSDHRIRLIQYNVIRGVFANVDILSLLKFLPPNCNYLYDAPQFPRPSPATNIPPTLIPTTSQLTVPHNPWIAVWPMPQLRDNMIRLQGTFDHSELWDDLLGGWKEGRDEVDLKGMIVWRDPWDWRGWELTEGFVKKWGFLLMGCEEAIEPTNSWRAARGEPPLEIEL